MQSCSVKWLHSPADCSQRGSSSGKPVRFSSWAAGIIRTEGGDHSTVPCSCSQIAMFIPWILKICQKQLVTQWGNYFATMKKVFAAKVGFGKEKGKEKVGPLGSRWRKNLVGEKMFLLLLGLRDLEMHKDGHKSFCSFCIIRRCKARMLKREWIGQKIPIRVLGAWLIVHFKTFPIQTFPLK